MKIMMMIIAMVLGVMAIQAQTPEDRTNAAAYSQEWFESVDVNVTFKAYLYENKALMISGPLTHTEYDAVLILEYMSYNGCKWLFDNDGFLYICFEGLDKCYDREQILLILQILQ